jgi:hypothetical protein
LTEKAYTGDYMTVCQSRMFDFSKTHAIVVSGDKWNPCGHMVLNTGGVDGMYFHVDGLRNPPKYMANGGLYRKYLGATGKPQVHSDQVPGECTTRVGLLAVEAVGLVGRCTQLRNVR